MSRCKADKYCSVECQKAAWPTHKLLCKQAPGVRKVQQEKDFSNWCIDESVRFDLTKLAAYGLHAIPPAQSLVGGSAMVVDAKYNPVKRTVTIQNAQILQKEVRSGY
jgi:MYND finger